MEPQLEDIVLEVAAEAALVGVLPLPVDDLEGDVFVGGARGELEHREVGVVLDGNLEGREHFNISYL